MVNITVDGFPHFEDNNPPREGTYVLPPGARLATMREAGLADDQPAGTKPAPGVHTIYGNTGADGRRGTEIWIYEPDPAGVPGAATGGTIVGVNAGGIGTGAGPGVGDGRITGRTGPVYDTLKSPVTEKITISNPLHQFASYSYAISLWKLSLRDFNLLMANTAVEGAMTWQPTFIRGSPKESSFVVAEDSGLYPDYRVPNTYGFNYNIEDLEFVSILSNNKQKGSSVIEGSLTVVEPIGCTFLDLLVQASWDGTEYVNYTQQPYMIQIDFKGYDDNGNEIPKSEMKLYRKRLPIKILTVGISVDKKGSSNKITFCPTGAAAFLPDRMPIPVEISIKASTVKEFFDQLGKELNEASANLIPGAANYANEYEFVVDKTIGNSKIVDETWMKFTEAETKATKAGQAKSGISFTEQTFTIPAKSNLINVIGRMMMQADFFTTLQDIGEVRTNRITKLDQIYNTFKITAKTEYQGLNQDGQRVARVFDNKTGSMPQKYTIYINQFSVYQNPHPRANNALVDARLYAIKKYDYIYTGKNLDITDLDITFNTTYYTAFMADPYNIASTEVGPGTKLAEDVVSKTRDIIVHPGTIFNQLRKLANPSPFRTVPEPVNPATADKNPNVQTAKDMSRSLFQRPGGDMIVCELGIVGDPTLIKQDDWLYTPDPTAGGDYNASTSQATFASTHGHVRMDTAEVVVELNVNTPLDMDMDIEGGYGNQGLYFPGPGVYRSLFSGSYKIITIKNNFSKGIFTQKLELGRYLNDTLVRQGATVVLDAAREARDNATISTNTNAPPD